MQPEGYNGVDGEKEKDEGRAKSVKVSRIICNAKHYTFYQSTNIKTLDFAICFFAGKQRGG